MNDNSFPRPLLGTFVGKGQWKLVQPFEYHSKKYGIIKVPAEFIADGASIPRFAYTLIGSPWEGRYVKSSVIHDWLYHKQYDRKKADLIFLEGMKLCKVPFWKRKVMFYSLRLFGWISFRKK